ncbi:MAG: hypothetical protein HZC40_01225 [Chloroflexi bacterium]|nr:hypothetical protein [Chloroflexota bacterium]
MRKPSNRDDYELRDQYDLSKMTIVPKGRYAPHRRVGKNVVVLAPDVAQVFSSDATVNAALRLVIQMNQVTRKRGNKTGRASKSRPRVNSPARLSVRATT